MVAVYKWGGIAFDDMSVIKTLILPSPAADNVPITFHDNGANYQVPGGKVFIVGKVMWAIANTSAYGRIGESDAADGGLTKEVINLNPHATLNRWQFVDVLGVYAAGKYVTGETSNIANANLSIGTTLYGVEIDA